jgi:hypothetical protein
LLTSSNEDEGRERAKKIKKNAPPLKAEQRRERKREREERRRE